MEKNKKCGMPLKFNEPTKTVAVRVPESIHPKLKEAINLFVIDYVKRNYKTIPVNIRNKQ